MGFYGANGFKISGVARDDYAGVSVSGVGDIYDGGGQEVCVGWENRIQLRP
ncbi:MAG: hypothetical protein ABI680_04405 [Chthoniobacteraceae bacterium]